MVLLMELPAPVRDDTARQALAEAVAARQAALADVEATRRALVTAEADVSAAYDAKEAAAAALDGAAAVAVAHRQAEARGDAGPPPPSMRSLRQGVQDAEDAWGDARAVVQGLREQTRAADPRQELRAMRVKDAALAVIRAEAAPVVAGLAAELQEAQRTAVRLGRVLEWMAGIGAAEMTPDLKAAVGRHTHTPPCNWFREIGAPDPARAWQDVLARLEGDPEAPAVARA